MSLRPQHGTPLWTMIALAVLAIAAPCRAEDAHGNGASEPPKHRDLGAPLVDNPAELTRLHPQQPIWVDKKQKQVVLLTEVCKADYLLEFLVTYPERGYESVLVTNVRPSLVHAALLAVGASPGKPVTFDPEFAPPSGTEIEIRVRWKDKDGRRQEAPVQEWIRDAKTKKSPEMNWVFAGGRSVLDETTGKAVYLADGAGDLVSTSNVPAATLDLPIESTGDLDSRLFEGFKERLPPAGTPVTLLLKPKLPKGAENTKEAVEEHEKEIWGLIAELRSGNPAPTWSREQDDGDRHEIVYPASYDPAKQRRVEDAWDALVRKGTVAFPLLVKHLDDHSYSYTSSGKPYWSVGDVCFRIITSQVEVFHEILGGDRRFQDAFLETPSQVKEWWQRNSKKTLREMQIEAARWELARQKNGNAREGRANQIAALERMIRTLSRANRPILVDRFGEIQEKTDATRSVEK